MGGKKIKIIMLQSQKHSALPRRAFIFTTKCEKEQDGSKLYKHRKRKEANIFNLFLVKAGVTTYTLNYTFYK